MENYIVRSLETHLFFGRIMKEHSLFLLASFPEKETNYRKQADWYRMQFERALDVTVQKQVLELLSELKEKEGLSFLLICHDLALVQTFCDEVLVLCQGKVVERGVPDEIINHPGEDYTRVLVESVL